MSLRVSQLVIQVLRSGAAAPGISVAATTSFSLSGSGVGANPVRHVAAASNITLIPSPRGGGDFEVSAETGLLVSANPFVHNTSQYVSATTGLAFSLRVTRGSSFAVAASSVVVVSAGAVSTNTIGPGQYAVSAQTSFSLAGYSDRTAIRIYYVDATTSLVLGDQTVPSIWGVLHRTGLSAFGLSVSATAMRVANAWATTSIILGGSGRAGRDVNASATTAMGLAVADGSNAFEYQAAATTFAFAGSASVVTAGKEARASLRLYQRADARVVLPSGGGVPGGTTGGLRTLLLASTTGEFPNSYAETPSGLILVANGIDPMVRWDAMTGLADAAGVIAPASAPEFGGVGVGLITGRRVAYCRFVDRTGVVSNLGPVSNEVDFGRDGLIDRIQYDPATGQVTVTSPGHGLVTGSPILIDGVEGLPVNGEFTATVLDADRFTLDGLVITSGRHLAGGRWVYGIDTILYGSVPTATQDKVVRRQILRNLAGNADVFFVDIDTEDLTSAAFASRKSDDELAAGEPVALFAADDTPHANRHGAPPSHKAYAIAHQGRVFAAGEVSYVAGNAEPVFGQSLIRGTGTAWRTSMVGRMVYLAGAATPYEIAAVDEEAQEITTTAIVSDATGPFTSYAIRPAPAERKLVYYSEPGLPESWPAWNAIGVPEDSDEITGLMVKGSFLYVLERRHIYKLTFQGDPARDGFVFLSTRRGCVNHRCHVQVEDAAFLLDESGVYRFDGGTATPISTPIQNLFQQLGDGLQVNWQADQRYWHAAHDPTRDTIRWFVAMTGHLYPRHALAYDYRRDRWWIEEYPFAMSASTTATIGYRRSLAGSEARRVLCLGEGALDAVDAGNGLRGYVTSAGPTSLTDLSAPFPPGLAGAPVSIAQGKGFGQQRRIAANTADTLRVDRPWIVRPDATSVYQVGGINWSWQSGWFRYVEEEQDNCRDVEVVFQPVRSPSSISMRLYYDHSGDPRVWSRTIEQDGTATIDGLPEVALDMTYPQGQSVHRLTGHRDPRAVGDSFVSVELAGVQAGDIHRIYQVVVNGVRQP